MNNAVFEALINLPRNELVDHLLKYSIEDRIKFFEFWLCKYDGDMNAYTKQKVNTYIFFLKLKALDKYFYVNNNNNNE